MSSQPRELLILLAGCFSLLSIASSSWLIAQHQLNMSWLSVQSKICAIIWMVPIYSVNSFLSLLFPKSSLYIDMLRDCYEAYVLYVFLSLMLSYLGADDREGQGYLNLVGYLETKVASPRLPFPFSKFYSGELPSGQKFLTFCKFGTLQYCVVRPLTTLLAILLDLLGLYHEANFEPRYGYIYLMIVVNLSIAFAMVVLVAFYSTLKKKLSPYHPVGKFLCIKFVIFFAFWQSVIIALLVKFGVIHDVDGYSASNLARGLQDTLISGEMFIVSIAHLFTFSYKPFTSEGQRGQLLSAVEALNSTPVSKMGGRGSASILSKLKMKTAATNAYASPATATTTDLDTDVYSLDETKITDADIEASLSFWTVTPQQSQRQSNIPTAVTARSSKSTGTSTSSSTSSARAAATDAATSGTLRAMRMPLQIKGRGSGNSNRGFGEGERASFIDKHFAGSAAVRDFNEAMPMVVLPSGFQPGPAQVVVSRPADRLRELRKKKPKAAAVVAAAGAAAAAAAGGGAARDPGSEGSSSVSVSVSESDTYSFVTAGDIGEIDLAILARSHGYILGKGTGAGAKIGAGTSARADEEIL
jgi:Organic solute transporter Ostalpha